MSFTELKTVQKSSDFSTFTACIMEPDIVDAHGDIVSQETVKKAAYDYFKNQNKICGINHEEATEDILLVESYLLKQDTNFDDVLVKKGSWIGEFEVRNQEKKEQIQNGNFTGVSIGGRAFTSEIRKSLEPKRNLDVVFIDEISLVDAPANQKPILKLNKRDEEKMSFEKIMKFLEDEEMFEKVQKALKDKKKSKDKDEDEEDEEEIEKSLSPSHLRIFKQNQRRLEELEKKQEIIEKKAFQDKTIELKKAKIKVTPTLSESLYKISKSHPEAYKDIEKSLFDAVDTIKKSDLTIPVGVDVHDDNVTDSDRITSIAKRLVKENPSLTMSKAFDTVIKNKLYKTEE